MTTKANSRPQAAILRTAKGRPPKTKQFSVRLRRSTIVMLDQLCRSMGQTRDRVLHRALSDLYLGADNVQGE